MTVMKVDSHLQVDPSTVSSMPRALPTIWYENQLGVSAARCRWLPHERMVVDAMTKRHGNCLTMPRLLRDGVLSVVDEDQELAIRETYCETQWDRRNEVVCSHTIKADEISWSEQSFLFDEARCASAFLGCDEYVVYLCLSFSSDEHHHSHSCTGTGMRVGT